MMSLSKRARVNPISVKRKNDNVLRSEMMEAKYGPREEWRCLFWDYVPEDEDRVPRCYGPVNGHEIIKASQWRAGRLVPENVITLCNMHNDWIEEYPARAYVLGLTKHAWERNEKL